MSEIDRKGSLVIIRPGRDVVYSMVDSFVKELKQEIEKSPSEIVIDLAKVEMVDSVGIGVIIAAHNSLKKIGGKMRVENVCDNIYRTFIAMRLNCHFGVEKSK